jgi:hypothetical protein
MNIEIQISFSENSIVLQSGDTTKHFANLIGIDKTTNKIVSIGQAEQEISTINPKLWEENKHKIVFEPIFESQKFDPEKMSWAAEYLTVGFCLDVRGMKFSDRILCYAAIPNYEMAEIKARENFEFRLESLNNLKVLVVNGKTIFSKGWQYNLAKYSLEWGWLIVLMLLLSGSNSLAIRFLRLSALYFSNFFPIRILLFILLIFGSLWLIEITWMFGMQILFPKKTLRQMFDRHQRTRTKPDKFSISRVFADLILGKDE